MGWQTSTDSAAYQLPVFDSYSLQLRVLNATSGQPLYAYVALGPEGVIATAWTGPPPAECDFIIAPDESTIISLTPVQIRLAQLGQLYAAAVLYSGSAGIYFTPGVGLAS